MLRRIGGQLAGFMAVALFLGPGPAAAQSPQSPQPPKPRPYGRISFFVTENRRLPGDGPATSDGEFSTSFTFKTPDLDLPGLEGGIDLRHTRFAGTSRSPRLSIYDGFAGVRLGARGQVRVRAGHMWLPDLGTAGALAGGLVEFRSRPTGAPSRWIAGAFGGAEPLGYEAGYATGVRKVGGYVSLEHGFLRRHVVGFANIRQRGVTERSMLTVANYIPAGHSFFAYQALEYDITGPARGAARRGLSYFLLNARGSAGPRVELQGTYNRGRSIDARQLTDDVINGRPLSARAVDGLRYETAGARVSVKVARRIEVYGGYARDRNNREDIATGRTTLGFYSTSLLGSGLDVAGSDALIQRPSGPYHSRYLSVGRAAGRSIYLSADYSTSLAVVRYLRDDGLVIETRPWTRRFSGNVSANLNRQFSILTVVDFTRDEGLTDFRMMAGLVYRVR